MKISVRHQAVEILNKVSASDAFASPLINDYLDKNDLSGTPDGRLLTHIVYGVLRLRGHLDWILSKLYRGDFDKMDEGIKNVLRVGLYQLKFSDRLPAFAVVNEAVKTAKIIQPEKSALVNAVLRNYLRHGQNIAFPSLKKNPAEYMAAFHSHPLWLVKEWIKIFGPDETKLLCSANNELPPLTLRVNTLKISREEIKQKLVLAEFTPEDTEYSPDGMILNTSANPIQKTDFFENGFLRIQDEAAQLISYLINPEGTESMLDACAGSGGKATHLAAILKNKEQIIAVDRNTERLAELKQEAARLGINIIETQTGDLSVSLPDSFNGKFDHVLVDAPCSGLGTLRRNPEIKWRTTEKDLRNFTAAQKIILQNASAAVKKGGRLIYCTCSLLPRENENIIDDFLKLNSNFSICLPPALIDKQLIDSRGFFHTYPHKHNMDGFFGAILKRQ
ncbi:MAG: 16S rRNA (cytosine(967)-C(5))-methyltransferase RsmB [Deltaproteobacteria bacterium HGW-Deltaproteobacteria-13]|jgi:16S rRNA (cytosine967-C5)-methyltransferase|nr:MAG: 16S rRNA (cytosine(967)-C(5))-methyltransferase RsmB [Deltaproteobacteria bacterium HGW-Deltaproteobacteria-13]